MLKRSTKFSCGYDLPAAETYTLAPGERKKIATGIKLNIPNDVWGEIKSRSSLAAKGIDVCGGVIDADYHDEVFVMLHNYSTEPYIIAKDSRIAQIIFQKYYEINESVNNVERNGGFGSTGL